MLLLLALAIAPGAAIAVFIYRNDKYDKEPRRLLIVSFLLGMVSTIPAALVEAPFGTAGHSGIIPLLLFAFLIVGVAEELAKFLMLRAYAYRSPAFNEPYDGIIYAVMVAMGFATLENIFYVQQYGMEAALSRMFTAVPMHAVCGIIMGYYAGKAKFKSSSGLLMKGVTYAALLHGAYDFSLMADQIPLMFTGAGISLYYGIRFSLKAIREQQQHSPFNHVNDIES